ncbi:hypothetical protein BASA81_014090 [Batrachochytrium salamandrivorans]|nr:hypothetical protein BASA81_014090 [Batrachochytrium salamandrivorans]
MHALEHTFPSSSNLLCVWHVQKNVLAKCKRQFTGEGWEEFLRCWTGVVKARTEEDFIARWRELCASYDEETPSVINYLQDTWLPYKERFVSAWANRYLHLGNTATSRVGGAHATLKKYLQVSTANLFVVYEKILLLLEQQYNEIKAMVGKDRIRTPHALNTPFYSQVINNISSFALKKVHQEFLKASRASDYPLGPCHCTLETSMGLPCAHIIRTLITNNQKVRTNDFHQHWWIDGREIPQPLPAGDNQNPLQNVIQNLTERYATWPSHHAAATLNHMSEIIQESPVVLQNPLVPRTRGRPVGARNNVRSQSSTQRDLSAFELAEQGNNSRRCSVCRQIGHNSRSCPHRMREV